MSRYPLIRAVKGGFIEPRRLLAEIIVPFAMTGKGFYGLRRALRGGVPR